MRLKVILIVLREDRRPLQPINTNNSNKAEHRVALRSLAMDDMRLDC